MYSTIAILLLRKMPIFANFVLTSQINLRRLNSHFFVYQNFVTFLRFCKASKPKTDKNDNKLAMNRFHMFSPNVISFFGFFKDYLQHPLRCHSFKRIFSIVFKGHLRRHSFEKDFQACLKKVN